MLVLLAGCRSSQESQRLAGPVVFVDAAGNRMIVDNRGEKPAHTSSVQAESEAQSAVLDGVPTGSFRGDAFMDSEDFMNELEQRESQRFYVIPDGTGGKQTVEARQLGVDAQRKPEPPAPDGAVSWRVCRIIVPLLALPLSRRHDIHFPAEDDDGVIHAGYRFVAPEGARSVQIDAYVRDGQQAQVLLARLDENGRVLSIVNNMPTQSIPETVFRYATVVGKADLVEGAGVHYGLLDASRLSGRLPDACGAQLQPNRAAGQVTVQFLGSEE